MTQSSHHPITPHYLYSRDIRIQVYAIQNCISTGFVSGRGWLTIVFPGRQFDHLPFFTSSIYLLIHNNIMQSYSYHARRYRTLFAPGALDISVPRPRAAYTPNYSPVSNVLCGLPRTKAYKPMTLPLLVPIALGKIWSSNNVSEIED